MKCKWCGFEIDNTLWSYDISCPDDDKFNYNGFWCSGKQGVYPTEDDCTRDHAPLTKEDKVKQLLEKINIH